MGRKRMEEPALKSWEEVDSTLKQIREAEIALSKISADAERCMIDIREQAETEAQPYKDKIKRMELQLKEFTVLNKADLLPYVDFDMENAVQRARALNDDLALFELSCRNGQGLENWYAWLREMFRRKKANA